MPKKMVLNFPPHLIDQPITYRLIKDFGLVVNILRARITPREWGRVVERAVDGGRWQDAMAFLAEAGGGVETLAQEVLWHEERCIHCTACVAPCPTKALDVPDRQIMTVVFDRERCIACEICLKVCPYEAMEILFD